MASRAALLPVALLALTAWTAAAPQAAAPARVGFIGVWDRAQPMLSQAGQETALPVAFWRPAELLGTDAASESARGVASACDVLLVLNLSPEEAGPLRDLLKQLKAANPRLRILPLDARDSHTELRKASLLTEDLQVGKYWRPNGAINLRRMLHYVGRTYIRDAVPAAGTIEPPVLVPDFGFYDPARDEPFETFDAVVAFKREQHRWIEGAPVAALIIQQSFWVTHDTKVVDAEVRALERQGINPVVIFGDRQGMVTDLVTAAKPDLIVEDRHGSMWESRDVLEKLDAPYLRPISMLAYTVDQWRNDPAGLASRDVGMFMTLQESWGTVDPVVVGGLAADIQGFQLHEPIPDGIEKFARRAASWARLKRTANADKKIAIIFYNKGLGKDDLMRGSPTGAFLDGPESLMRLLPALRQHGYTLRDEPATSAALIARLKTGARNVGPWAPNDLAALVKDGDPALVPLSTYTRWFNERLTPTGRAAVIKAFGPPPGKIMVQPCGSESCIVIPRVQIGNVLLAPQPERGESQDEKLLHSRDVPPPHNYLAFYWWLEEQFHANAVVHWGTHGSLELLPGKEAGLSRDSWGDIAVGDMPVINLWISDNIAEATLSRRRSYAALVDHLPPPALAAGVSSSIRNLEEDLRKFHALEAGALKERYRRQISAGAHAERIDEILKLPSAQAYPDAYVEQIADYVQHLVEEQTPLSLHVLGESMARADQPAYLTSIMGKKFLDHVKTARPGATKEAATALLSAAVFDGPASTVPLTADLQKDLIAARRIAANLNDTQKEIDGLLHAFDGGYVTPGPGPDPIRNPETAPGGRNLYSLNPEEIPTQPAWEVATALVDDLLRSHKTKKIGMDLNGMNTMRDFGVMEAQILYLMGVRPIWDRNNLAVDLELISRKELGRPRVDVFIAMGGQYKENFPTRVELLDRAVRLASAADEPDNHVRLGTLENQRKLRAKGLSVEQAAALAPARIFGTKQGNMSGTNILYLVPKSGAWDRPSEIADVYIDNMSWVYTKDAWGQKVDGLYQQAIQGTDTLIRAWSSNMTSELSNHHSYEYLGGLSMAVKTLTGREPDAYIADVRNPDGARMREFGEVLATTFKTELLNKNWIAGMKEHGYAGAGHAAELVKNTFGWAVTRTSAVSDATWKEIYDVYVNDKFGLGVRQWMEKDNPHALQEMAATMLEASRKGYWHADAKTLKALGQLYQESVAKYSDSNGLISGGNTSLAAYAADAGAGKAGRPGLAPAPAPSGRSGRAAAAPAAPSSATPPPLPVVTGIKMTSQPKALPQAPGLAPRELAAIAAAVAACFALGYLRRQGTL